MARGKSLVGVCSALRSFPICGVDRLSLVSCGMAGRGAATSRSLSA